MPKGSDNVVEEVKAVKKNCTTRGFSLLDKGLGASKFVKSFYTSYGRGTTNRTAIKGRVQDEVWLRRPTSRHNINNKSVEINLKRY